MRAVERAGIGSLNEGQRYLSTSLQTGGLASLLATICALPQAPLSGSRLALTTDLLAELLVSKSRTPTDGLRNIVSGRNWQEQG
jgi:hypothetical protein